MVKKFLRRTANRYSKLGKGRKKKQRWRSPKGRDNKMREKRKGYPVVVSVGYKKNKEVAGKIKEKIPFMIRNMEDLQKIQKNNIGIIGNIGKKKKIEIVKKAKEMKIEIHNLNVKKFLEQTKKKVKPKKEEGKKTEKVEEKKPLQEKSMEDKK